MADEPRPDAEELARQLRQRLDSLRAAGVDWLPTRADLPPPESPPTPPEPAPAATPLPVVAGPGPDFQPSLFAGVAPAADLTPEQRREELRRLAERVSQCVR